MAKFKEGKRKELEKTLKQWKEFVKSHGKKYEHYDLTNDSWWARERKTVRAIVRELEASTDPENIKTQLRKLFEMKKEKKLLWAHRLGLINSFINTASSEELESFKNTIIEMNQSPIFKNEWVEQFYNLLRISYPEKTQKLKNLRGHLRNILGELYGKLHIEEAPIYNTCSREFVAQYFNFDKDNYEEFKDAFEKLKQEYRRIVGKLSEDSVPINAEIDMMFNFFDKADWRVEVITRTLKPLMSNCHYSWLQIKDELEKHLDKARELLLELLDKEEISEEDVSRLYEVVEKIEKDPRWERLFQEGYTVMYTKDMYQTMQLLSDTNLRKFLKDVWNAESLDEVLESKSWKDAWSAKYAEGTVLTSLAAIIRPDMFLPIHAGTVNERLIQELKLKPKFYYPKGKSSIKQTGEFLRIMYKAAESLQVENMLEIAYYLAYQNKKECMSNNGNGIPEKFRNSIQTQLNRKGQIILYGPPGTGKTWLARKYVIERTGEDKPGNRWEFITFHQSYSYEEFVEGFRPRSLRNGNKHEIWYVVEDGIFKKIALKALVRGLLSADNTNVNREKLVQLEKLLRKKEPLSPGEYEEYLTLKKYLWEQVKELGPEDLKGIFYNSEGLVKDDVKFYLVIDEINRGNISKILGELITLLEKDKRLGGDYPLIVTLPYSGEHFAVPPNLYIIGTMNTADRSIALLDVALRRRFAFIEVEPDPETLKNKNNIEEINLEELLKKLNVKIEAIKNRDHRIGHSYFIEVKDLEKLHFVWYYEIVPLLMEYFYNDWEALAWLLGDKFIENKLKRENKKLKFKKPSEIEGQVEPNTPYGIKFYNVKDEQEKKEFIKALEWIIESVKEEQSGS